MSDLQVIEQPKVKVKRTRQPKQTMELDDFKVWLAGLGSKPTLHVNGPNYASAIATVDFGTPLEEERLSPEQTAELVNHLRIVTKMICGEKDVRVQNDASNGIWWSSVG